MKVEPDVRLLAATIAGRRLDAAALARQGEGADGVVFQYDAAEGAVEVEVELPAGQPLRLRITDLENDLPPPARQRIGPRPAGVVPAAFGWSLNDASVVSRAVTF